MRRLAAALFLCFFVSVPLSAAVSFIGATTGTTSASLPSGWQAGDIAIVFAYRDGSNTAPTLPTGWTNIISGGANTNSERVGFRILQSGDTGTGTWTNATSVVCHVYRGQLRAYGASTPAIPNAAQAGGNGTTVTYPALTMRVTNGSSWVAGFAGHRSTNTALETPPTGMTNRADVVDSTDEAAGHDTNGGVTSWSQTTVDVGGTGSGWRGVTIEIEAEPDNAPHFRSQANTAGTLNSPLTISRPANVAENDVLIAVIYHESTAGGSLSGPSGWTEIAGASGNQTAVSPAFRGSIWWHRVGPIGSEPTSYSWTWSGGIFTSGAILAYVNVEQTGDPVDVSSFAASTASGTSATATSVTTTTAADLLLYLNAHNTTATVTPPTGMGENADVQEMEEANRAQAAAGATGNKTGTLSAAGGWTASLVALLPETGAPPAAEPPLRRKIDWFLGSFLDWITSPVFAQSTDQPMNQSTRPRFPPQFRPTPMEWVREALRLASVGPKEIVYDLGSGDGRVVGLAVRSFGAKKGVGVEIIERLVEQARAEWPEATFIRADFRDVAISDATVVFVWIGSAIGYNEAWKHLARWCKPGTRVLMPRGRPAPARFKLLRSSEHFDLWELAK